MSEPTKLSLEEARTKVGVLLSRHGVASETGAVLADVIIAAERDGTYSHGFSRLAGYISTLRSGWVSGDVEPIIKDVAPSLVRVNACNGFTQVAMRAVQPLAERKCRETGIVCVTITHGHHFAALWTDVEPWAERGLVAITFVNSRPRMAVWGSKKAVLGTNPMAFACPRRNAPPVVWDQASSVRSHGDVLIAARANRPLPGGVGVDAKGAPTTDANAILSGGAILPFGGHKGASLAFMAEIMVAALGGGNLGFEDKAADYPGAVTCDTGQTLILIDPVKASESRFFARVEDLVDFFVESGIERLPADRRYRARRESERSGLPVSPQIMELLENG